VQFTVRPQVSNLLILGSIMPALRKLREERGTRIIDVVRKRPQSPGHPAEYPRFHRKEEPPQSVGGFDSCEDL